jgi:hypothetical protein
MFEGFFFVFFAFKENVIEGDGPKNQTQSSLLSWLFFSKLLMPRRSQGFSIKLVLTLMNFYDNKIYY